MDLKLSGPGFGQLMHMIYLIRVHRCWSPCILGTEGRYGFRKRLMNFGKYVGIQTED